MTLMRLGPLGLHILLLLSLFETSLQSEKILMNGYPCYSITCRAGEEPVACNKYDDRSASCQPCSGGTFSDGRTRLGERCTLKTFCEDDHMTVVNDGSPTMDRECGCEEGYRLSYWVHKCYRLLRSTTAATSTTPTTIKTATTDVLPREVRQLPSASNASTISVTAMLIPSLLAVCMGMRWKFGSINYFLHNLTTA